MRKQMHAYKQPMTDRDYTFCLPAFFWRAYKFSLYFSYKVVVCQIILYIK